jgi:hypothetical protein
LISYNVRKVSTGFNTLRTHGVSCAEGDWINSLKNKTTTIKKRRPLTTNFEERYQVTGAHGRTPRRKIGGILYCDITEVLVLIQVS